MEKIAKQYLVGLEILDDRIELSSPSGRRFSFPLSVMPAALYGIVRQCLLDDQNQIKALESTLHVDISTQPVVPTAESR